MAGNELNVKNIDEIKRLWKLGIGKRQIARALGVHRNTVSKYLEELQSAAQAVGAALEAPPAPTATTQDSNWTSDVDWEKIRSEYLSGIPLNIIHDELFQSNQVPVQYPGFWKQAQKKIALTEATMVRIFKPGDRIEIDYADGIDILDPITGELRKTELFVGVLCHSRYAFAEFTWSQASCDFLQSHVNMYNFFGGSAQVLSPDNLKSAVTKAHRYDPVINQAYARLAAYYEVAVVPARVRTPKDKAIVERTIQIFQRWFFMTVRHKTFTSLLELNQCLREHLILFNQKKHRIFKRTREEMFKDEQSHLNSLPPDAYYVATHKQATLSRDCHLAFEQNFYSGPHHLRGKLLDVWATATTIEIFFESERVAFHGRSKGHGKFITNTSHYPPAQQSYAEEDIQKIIERAEKVGPETEALVKGLLDGGHPLQHFRRCQGVIALAGKYSSELLEGACKEANRFNNRNVPYIERVIKNRKGVQRVTENTVSERSYNPHLRGINNIH